MAKKPLPKEEKFITRKQYSTIPPTVEYSLADRGKTLIPVSSFSHRRP